MKINENIEVGDTGFKINERNILVIGLKSNQVINTTANTKINLDKIISQLGTKLEMYNNGIKIGANVHHVIVSAQIICNSITGSGLRRLYVNRNNTLVSRSMAYYEKAFESTITTANIFIEVQENDLITIVGRNDGQSTTIYNSNNFDTYLTVEVID